MALVGCAKQIMSEGKSGPIGLTKPVALTLLTDVVSGWCVG